MTKVTVDGLQDLQERLRGLEMHKRAAFAKKVLKEAAAPLVQDMKAGAPVNPDRTKGVHLRDGIGVSAKLSPRQKRHQGRPDRSTVEMFVGAGAAEVTPHAHLQEFGTRHHAAKPFARPAWEANRSTILERIRKGLADALTRIGR